MGNLQFGISFYDSIFRSSKNFQNYVDAAIYDITNSDEWRKWFPKAAMPTDGTAITVNEVVKHASPAPDVRARFSQFTQSDKDGFKSYMSGIPDFGHGIERLTLADKEKYQKMAKIFDANQTLIDQYTEKVADHIKAASGALTYMAKQLLTTTQISYQNGMGLEFSMTSVPFPSANKYHALTAVWSASNAKPLDDMHYAEDDFRQRTRYQGELYWRFDEDTARYFLNNSDVIAKVGNYIASQSGLINLNNGIGISVEQYNKWADTTHGWVSKIEVVKKGYIVSQTISGRTENINGWTAGRAVLTPVGVDGSVEWVAPTEFTLKQGLPNYAIATLEGGMIGLENRYNDNNEPVWQTNYIMSAVPVMRRWNHHCILNTLSTTSW